MKEEGEGGPKYPDDHPIWSPKKPKYNHPGYDWVIISRDEKNRITGWKFVKQKPPETEDSVVSVDREDKVRHDPYKGGESPWYAYDGPEPDEND